MLEHLAGVAQREGAVAVGIEVSGSVGIEVSGCALRVGVRVASWDVVLVERARGLENPIGNAGETAREAGDGVAPRLCALRLVRCLD